ncbi:MAG: hypothetical protein OXC62_07515, partial [Aestuariivita sp.]|nr:hypothetical protein [Aestuariivita sp.]
MQKSAADFFDCDGGKKGHIGSEQSLDECKPSKVDFSIKPVHIITIVDRAQTSAQAEPVDGICLDAKNRINGAVRCAVFV